MSRISKLTKLYKSLLNTHFVAVQAVQTGILMGTGDVIAQTLIEKKSIKNLNRTRTLQFMALGTSFVGPSVTVWYRFLSRRIQGAGKSALFKKVALDQLLFAPSFLVAFICALQLIQGGSLEKAKFELKHKYRDILLTNYKIWPAVQLINFYFVPLHGQVVLVQCVAIIWNAYLSWKTQTVKDFD